MLCSSTAPRAPRASSAQETPEAHGFVDVGVDPYVNGGAFRKAAGAPLVKAAPLEARRELTPVRGVFCCRCQGLDYVREVARLEKLGVDMSKVGSSAIIGDAQGAGTREAFCSHHIPLGGAAQGNTSCGMPFGSMVRRHPVLLDFPRKIPILPPLTSHRHPRALALALAPSAGQRASYCRVQPARSPPSVARPTFPGPS